MTVQSSTARNQYTATSGQTVFTYTFEISQKEDIAVLRNGTLLSEGTHYTVSGVGVDAGGNITLLTASTAGDIITIYRDMLLERLTDYQNAGDFLAVDVNDDFDRLWLAIQQGAQDNSRALVKPITDAVGIDMTLDAASVRANCFLTFDENGEPALAPAGDPSAPTSIGRQEFTGDGSQTTFVLSRSTGASQLMVMVDGLVQAKSTYTVEGANLIFGEAPPVGSFIEVAQFKASEVGGADSDAVTFIQAGSNVTERTLQSRLRETVSVKDFGAKGDYNGSTGTDDTAAFQAAVDYCMTVGAHLHVPFGWYLIKDTIDLETNWAKAFSIGGDNGNSTRIYFDNAVTNKNMFQSGGRTNYLEIHDLEFIDVNVRTSRCFYFKDTRAPDADDGLPSWKHVFRNVRINSFKEGAKFDGGTTVAADAHCSEVLFIHSKTRNCETGLIYNNTQAVNHQLIAFDMENDQETGAEEWAHIYMTRGTTLNHFGGSVIGRGSYLKYTYSAASQFPETSRFLSKGVRVEKRGTGNVSPLIDQTTDSKITLSNWFRINIEDMGCIITDTSMILGRFGGQTLAQFSNVSCSKTSDVQVYMTPKLSSNDNTGKVEILDCTKVTYSKIKSDTLYDSSGEPPLAATNYKSIPIDYSLQTETKFMLGTGSFDDPFYSTAEYSTQYAGKAQVSRANTLSYVSYDDTTFLNNAAPQEIYMKLPVNARPYKFRAIRDIKWTGTAGYVLELYFRIRVSGTPTDILVATLTMGSTNCGHFEADIVYPVTAGIEWERCIVDDGTEWDGTFKIVKAAGSTSNGFTGMVMIDYM